MLNSHGYIARMRTADVLAYYGTQTRVAEELGIEQPSVAKWGEYPPPLRQIQIEQKTGGELLAEADIFRKPTLSQQGRPAA